MLRGSCQQESESWKVEKSRLPEAREWMVFMNLQGRRKGQGLGSEGCVCGEEREEQKATEREGTGKGAWGGERWMVPCMGNGRGDHLRKSKRIAWKVWQSGDLGNFEWVRATVLSNCVIFPAVLCSLHVGAEEMGELIQDLFSGWVRQVMEK